MTPILRALFAALLCLSLASGVRAATEEYKGTAKGKNSKTYLVEVTAGQTLAIELKAKSSAVHFNVSPPTPPGTTSEPIFKEGRSWSQKLEKPGRYKIDVFLEPDVAEKNGQASFTLSVTTEP